MIQSLSNIIREQRNSIANQEYFPQKSIKLQPRDVSQLCKPCEYLDYCQYAKHLSFNHLGHNDIETDQRLKQAVITSDGKTLRLPDQHILAAQDKLRYQTCPFHRELSLGYIDDVFS